MAVLPARSDHQRDELFRKLVGPVVVRAVGDQSRKAIGAMPSQHQVVGSSLACRIWGAWIVGRRFAEQTISTERTEDFVGRDMEKTEAILDEAGRRPSPIAQSCLKQSVRTNDVGFDEGCRAIDGAVDMTFRRQVNDRLGLKVAESVVYGRHVTDVRHQTLIVGETRDGSE